MFPHTTTSIYVSNLLFAYYEDARLHHGRFLFRHKGKRKKGKPNYPPTKLISRTMRKCSKPDRGQNIRDRERRRESQRKWTAANKERNQRRREARLINRSPNVVRLFEPKGIRMFAP
jgi:hypothetical protein